MENSFKCIVCGKSSKTEEGLKRHQEATYHRVKDCDCHCHCLDRITRGGKCSCEKKEWQVECNHCKELLNEKE